MGGEGETVYSFFIGMLRDLLVKERVYLKALSRPADELERKLIRMEELLEYAHVRRDKRTKEIIDLADQLIHSIETYVQCVVFKTSGRNFLGIKERLLRPKVRLAMKNITTKLNDFINSQSDVAASSSGSIRRAYKVQDLSNLIDEKDFVGREKDINKLVSHLVDKESEKFRVISIHGLGGLGKTTLVRKVYKHEKVLSHFEAFAFVCVSEQCETEAILKHILQQLGGGEKKCLIIIDDIWSVGDWENLNRGLPKGSLGSKVVLTTRIKDVADKGFCFSINSLSENESWELFRKKIFMDQDSEMDQRKEELGRKMIAWCSGVPLAVLVLRGVLVTKGSAYEWQRFYESRQWEGKVYGVFHEEVAKELLFSYNELPYPLKPCFLSLAYFAEDEEVDADVLYRLWDAEGMILSKDKGAGETMFDVAQRYLGELVGRSMVEAKLVEDVIFFSGRNFPIRMTCRLHDLMRGLCLSIAEKENFLMYRDYRGHGDGVVVLNSTGLANGLKMPARQALNFGRFQACSVDDNQEANRHVTSLIFTSGRANKVSNLKKLNSLRVLKFVSNGEEEASINGLIHIRYLELISNGAEEVQVLPSSIDKLIYLQTLDLQNLISIPIHDDLLRKLKRLRHLLLPENKYTMENGDLLKLRTDGLTELETIVNFDSRKFDLQDVTQLSSLRRLKGRIFISSEDDGKELVGGSMNKLNLEPMFSSLEIYLENPKAEMYWDVIRGQVAENFKGTVDELEIRNLRGKLLPGFSNYGRLTELRLNNFEVEEDPMSTLEKLPSLRRLQLDEGKLKGIKEMACSAMSFPQLRVLKFDRVGNWEKWRVEEGAMPNLYLLSIEECRDLEMLPDGLKFITSLQMLGIEGMGEGLKRRLKGRWSDGGEEEEEEGPDFHKIQHVLFCSVK